MADDSHAKDVSTSLTAGAAGAGSGTLLVLLANNLAASSPWKSWLVIIAPSASIAIAFAWKKISAVTESYLRKRELKLLVAQAQGTLKQALQNKNTSNDHRKRLMQELEQLELLLVQTDVEKIKNLQTYR